ncbi:MAG: NADPH-dependent F420 reductase [Candidatus Bathyarchaeota archaeon]
MKIGIVGGTGSMGQGLAVRWAMKHDVLLGSRALEKAEAAAVQLERIGRGFYRDEMQGSIKGYLNSDAVKGSEVVVVTLPPEPMTSSVKELRTFMRPEQIVVSTVVPMMRKKGLFYCTAIQSGGLENSEGKSAAEMIQEIVKPVPVASAFQTVPAQCLSSIASPLNMDVLIAANDEHCTDVVSRLICDIPTLRPIRVGPLENSRCIESVTPLLLNAAILNKLKEPSIRIVPWMPTSYTH